MNQKIKPFVTYNIKCDNCEEDFKIYCNHLHEKDKIKCPNCESLIPQEVFKAFKEYNQKLIEAGILTNEFKRNKNTFGKWEISIDENSHLLNPITF